jgi:rare lipoprotein A
MPMTARQRTVTFVSLGLVLLSMPGQASLERIPQRTRIALPTFVKTRMIVSWYGKTFQGRITASGEKFDLQKLTAAHKTLPLGSLVRLTVKSTGRSVVVRINDRGPWIKGRDFDLSEEAAIELGIHEKGISTVEAMLFASDFSKMVRAQKP